MNPNSLSLKLEFGVIAYAEIMDYAVRRAYSGKRVEIVVGTDSIMVESAPIGERATMTRTFRMINGKLVHVDQGHT